MTYNEYLNIVKNFSNLLENSIYYTNAFKLKNNICTHNSVVCAFKDDSAYISTYIEPYWYQQHLNDPYTYAFYFGSLITIQSVGVFEETLSRLLTSKLYKAQEQMKQLKTQIRMIKMKEDFD